jgi:hypothetical protein
MDIKADISALLRFAKLLGQVPTHTKTNVARAINAAGNNIMLATARKIANKLGVAVEEVVAKIRVTEATANKWRWEMDTSEVTPPSGDWDRPWDRPAQEQVQEAEHDVLVSIVTAKDEKVCHICEAAADENPHSMSEIHEMQAGKFLGDGEEAGLLHPLCRCVLKPYTPLRKLSVSLGEGIEAEPMTAGQIAEAIADSVHTVLRGFR